MSLDQGSKYKFQIFRDQRSNSTHIQLRVDDELGRVALDDGRRVVRREDVREVGALWEIKDHGSEIKSQRSIIFQVSLLDRCALGSEKGAAKLALRWNWSYPHLAPFVFRIVDIGRYLKFVPIDGSFVRFKHNITLLWTSYSSHNILELQQFSSFYSNQSTISHHF